MMLPEAIAIVCSPKFNEWGLTSHKKNKLKKNRSSGPKHKTISFLPGSATSDWQIGEPMRSPRVSRRAFTLTVKTRLFLPWVPRDDLRSNFKLTPNKKLFYILKNTKYVSLLWNEFVSLVFKRSMPATSPSPTTPSPWWICGDLRNFFFFPPFFSCLLPFLLRRHSRLFYHTGEFLFVSRICLHIVLWTRSVFFFRGGKKQNKNNRTTSSWAH